MATIGSLYPTLVDITKRMDPDGSVSRVVEALSKVNPILDDIAWNEGNLPTGHRYTSRTALPSLTWRKLNAGVPASKSTTDQYDETCGMLEGFSQVDEDVAALNGNAAAYRASEDMAFVQAFGIEVATGLFYHSVTSNPEKFQGLTPRLNATASNPASAQIIKADASASGANQTSMWFVGWSPDKVFGIYPRGSQAGLKNEDLGKQLVLDASNNKFVAYTTKWQWKCGLVVRDSRYLVRICNIDTTRWTADLSTGADLVQNVFDGIAAMWELNTVQPVIYMNRKCFSMFNKQLAKKGTVNLLEWLDRGGQRLGHILGVPIRVVDAITNTESVVS